MLGKMTIINCVLLLLALSSCRTIAPVVPALYSDKRDKIEPIVSRLNIDLEFNMSSLFDKAEKNTPLNFSGKSSICEGVSYDYKFYRSPIIFSTLPTQLETKIRGDFSLDLSYCPLCITLWGGKESCTVPRIYGSCGINEKRRRYEMSYLTSLGLSKDYRLTAKTKLKAFTIQDPCEITFFNYDVTDRVQAEIEKELKTLQKGIDKDLAATDTRSKIEAAWKDLQKPIGLDSYGFFQINPISFSATPLSYKGNIAKFSLSLFFSPVISSEKTPSPYVPLREMSNEKRGDGFEIMADLAARYDSLTSILQRTFKSEVISVKGKQVIVREIRVIGSQSNKLILRLDFEGFRKGTLYLVCRPVMNSETQTLSLTEVDFDIKTKALLLKSAKWLLGNKIKKEIEQKAQIDMSTKLNSLRSTLESKLNGELASGVHVKGKLDELRVRDILLSDSHLYVRASLTGSLTVGIE